MSLHIVYFSKSVFYWTRQNFYQIYLLHLHKYLSFQNSYNFQLIFPYRFVSKNGEITSNISKCFGGFQCLFAVVFVRFEVHA